MKLIQTQTLASTAASITFTSIPQDGTDLVLLGSLRRGASGVGFDAGIAFNGSSSGFTGRALYGTGSAAASFSFDTAFLVQAITGTNTSNTFANFSLTILNYAGATNKSFSFDTVTENNATEAYQLIQAGLWSNTAAITSLTISTASPDFAIGSTLSLYKITKGSDGIVTTSP